MNLKACFFFAALFVSCLTDELTPEECEPLIKPLTMAIDAKMHGKVHFLLGYADQEDYKIIMNLTDSYWGNVTVSPTNHNELLITQMDKINGTCLFSKMKLKFEGSTASAALPNMTLDYQFLPTCDGCMLALVNSSAKNLRKFLADMELKHTTDADEIYGRAFYLMANETIVKDSVLKQFKKQAHCLGFTGEPDFHYNPEKSFCKEGEGITLPDF
ncbi:uncharacterized protein LOC103369202 [Stegastes partitus]|uniref:Uncharacterized LOC103369202 n=1 Tax=Stegastes partitus TaxID=144197 RepID=A0A3B5AFL3_9TELE|nr:PREDICTED: uncharacterized protein LOC103369202 [Stegastes partitus]